MLFNFKNGKHPVRKHAVLSLYLYTSIETQNNHEPLTSWWRHQRELHFHDVNKRAIFAFLARYIRELSWLSSIACVASVPMRRAFSASRLRARANTLINLRASTSGKKFFVRINTLAYGSSSHSIFSSPWNVNTCLYILKESRMMKESRKMFVFLNWNTQNKNSAKIICLWWQQLKLFPQYKEGWIWVFTVSCI